MPIDSLEITNVRNLRSVTLSPSPSVNWFFGANGSGKTSVLESLFLLSTGRSFRSATSRQFINQDAKHCLVVCSTLDINNSFALSNRIGVERDLQGGFVARFNGDFIRRLSDLARLFPVVTLLPDSVELLTGDPGCRREFLDWTMFHVEHQNEYFDIYRRFTTALQNRNKLLKQLSTQTESIRRADGVRELNGWDEQFVMWGERLSALREAFVARLDKVLRETANAFGEDLAAPSYELDRVVIAYSRGWPQGRSLKEQVALNQARDIERGTTSSGPQRFDLTFHYGDALIKDYFSRGQLRHLTSLCKISQAKLFQDTHSQGEVIFLFDDAFGELDARHALSIITIARSLGLQVFVTSVEAPETKGFSTDKHDKMFHVEHGSIGLFSEPNLREQA